jgi:hypothetical protein
MSASRKAEDLRQGKGGLILIFGAKFQTGNVLLVLE